MDAERLRRFAKRIDRGLDDAARAGMLLSHPRFCVAADGRFYVTLAENPEQWGLVSVSEKHLATWAAGRAFDWTGWPRTFLQCVSRQPSRAALEIAHALLAQQRGHAGRDQPFGGFGDFLVRTARAEQE